MPTITPIRATILLTVTLLLLVQCASVSYGFPGFARKYGFECTMCHVQFPKLNDFGQRYRDNGYQVPGQEDMDKSALETPAPLALRTTVGYVSHDVQHTPEDSDLKEFNIGGLDTLFGGLFKENVGFFGIYTPRLDPAKGGDSQEGKLEMANVVFSHLGHRNVTLRMGRFEPGFLAFSAKRSFTFSGYEAYDFPGATAGALGGFALSDTQEGLEVAAHGRNGWHAVAGWVNGSQNHGGDRAPKDLYARVYKVFGAGEGQTAGQRVGLMAYRGKARPGDAAAGPQYTFERFGLDASLTYGNANLLAQYIDANDDRGFTGGASDYDWKGGFLELDHAFRPDIIGFARYDWVDTPASADNDIRAWVIGGRWNIERNLALHLEWASRRQDNPAGPRAKSDDLYLRLDMAF